MLRPSWVPILCRKMFASKKLHTVKLGDKERFDKEQIGVKELFPINK